MFVMSSDAITVRVVGSLVVERHARAAWKWGDKDPGCGLAPVPEVVNDPEVQPGMLQQVVDDAHGCTVGTRRDCSLKHSTLVPPARERGLEPARART